MNHIKELTIVRDGLSKQLAAYIESIEELKGYLLSSKFYEDTTVQVKDVLARLDEASNHSLRVREDHDNAEYAKARDAEEARLAKGRASCERCGKYGYDWEDVPLHGYTERLCPKCFKAAKHNHELA